MNRNISRIAVGLAAAIALTAHAQQPKKTSATMAMSWAFEGSHIGYLTAMERGLYKAEGLDVKVTRGFGAGDTIRRLITGDIEFGIVDAVLQTRAVSEDPKNQLVTVAMIFQTSPYNVIYVKNRKIKSVSDLATAKFGNTGGSAGSLYPSFLTTALKGTPSDKAQISQLDPAVRIAALLKGDVDVVASVLFEWPHIQKLAKSGNVEFGTFSYADQGFDPYTYGLVVRRDLLTSQPELVRGVVKASLDGWAQVCANRAAAAELLAKYQPDVGKEGLPEEIKIAVERIAPRGAEASRGLGAMNAARWADTHKTAVQVFRIAKPVAVDALYDSSFLPKTAVVAGCGA